MRVRGDTRPATLFSLESIPKKPGKVLCRFYQNVRKYNQTSEGVTVIGWQWDEYHLELPDYASLEADVTANAEALLKEAISVEEEENRIPDLLEAKKLLEAQVAAQADQMDFYEDCIVEMAEIIYA